MQKHHNKSIFKSIILIVATLSIIIWIAILRYNLVEKKNNTSPHIADLSAGIYIPKIDLPKNSTDSMDMIALIVYKSRVYTQTGTKINPKSAEDFIDQKLGTTKGNIDEWSNQNDYAVQFASTIGKTTVYSVKGYNENFRLMTYEKLNGIAYADFYECFNGITVKTGADVFDKLRIANNIKASKYENFESWNYNNQEYKILTNLNTLNNLVNELKSTIPYTQESLSYLWDENERRNQRFVYVTLNDGCEVQLTLFKDGYVYYNYSHILFKMDNVAFSNLWNDLK